MDRFLVIVTAEHEVHTHLRKPAEYFLRGLETVSLRELAFHRIVVHHDHACVRLLAAFERLLGDGELRLVKVPDYRDVAHVPGQRPRSDALRRIESDESRAGHVQYRLEIVRDELHVVLVHLVLRTYAERGTPPFHVVVARDGYRLADFLCVADEHRGPLKLTGARALRQVSGNGDHIELVVLNDLLDGFDLGRNRRPPEMQIPHVKNCRHGIGPGTY